MIYKLYLWGFAEAVRAGTSFVMWYVCELEMQHLGFFIYVYQLIQHDQWDSLLF